MSFSKTLKREFEVAFSKNAQPVWFRIVKYIVLGAIIYFFWGTNRLWIILGTVSVLGLSLHFWYRYKTNGWTKSYGAWDYEKNIPGSKNKA
jgi:hypothetical protein